MPAVYRAPEVILGMEWSYPVDVWSVAVMVRISSTLCLPLPARQEESTYYRRRGISKAGRLMFGVLL